MSAFVPYADIPDDVHRHILSELQKIEEKYEVKILFAIESGSRAWGFPSPDSDFDVRFVYVNKVDWYLSIFPGRDVIELPLVEDMDINGWDLKKALELLLKPNPVLLEWLSSPIRYIWDENVCQDLKNIADKISHDKACLYHYLNLGGRQWRAYIEDKDRVNLKKYLYVVRPAMAIRWIRYHPDVAPPMNFFELRDGVDLPQDLNGKIDDILEKKKVSKELGDGDAVPEINQFILEEFAWAEEAVKSIVSGRASLIGHADRLFRKLVKKADKTMLREI